MESVIYINILILFFSILGRYKKIFLFLAFLCLFLFLAFRFNYGSDYQAYFYYFLQVSEGGLTYEEAGKEIGWYLFNYISRNITFQGLVALHALFYVVSFYILIVKLVKPKYYWLAVFILIFDPDNMLIHLSAMRQSLAICFLILGCFQLNEKKNMKKVIGVILFLFAISIHVSSLIFIIAYFLLLWTRNRNINRVYGVLILVSSIVLFPLSLTIISLFPIPETYTTYLEESSSSIGIGFVITLFLFGVYLFRDRYISHEVKIYIRSVELGYFLTPIRYGVSMFGRIIFYFSVFNIIGFPILLKNIKSKEWKWIVLFVMIGFILYRFFMFFKSDITGDSYQEYHLIFNYL